MGITVACVMGAWQCTFPANVCSGGCSPNDEICDNLDNDCDGSVDEPFSAKGTNTANFVQPVVTKLNATKWIASFEASRPNATGTTPGSGNGYQTLAPLGTTLDKTKACFVQNKRPWFNVTPTEAEQTCTAMGGAVCTTAEWITACQVSPVATCTWGYNPRGIPGCTTSFTASKFCNLGPSYDFDGALPGDQDGLLVTGSAGLLNCWADWANLLGNQNPGPGIFLSNRIYDITGNLREITKSGVGVYSLMGGAFNTSDPGGATCTFSGNQGNSFTSGADLGFRCCFTADPTL
jgi:hypothetical protein